MSTKPDQVSANSGPKDKTEISPSLKGFPELNLLSISGTAKDDTEAPKTLQLAQAAETEGTGVDRSLASGFDYPRIARNTPEQILAAGELPKPSDTRPAFTDVSREQVGKLLDTPPGKDLPPIAEKFEEEALRQFGPEKRPNIYVSKEANDRRIPFGVTSYRTINEAVKHAPPGSVIQVLPGVYRESIDIGPMQSMLTIQTDRQNPAIIDHGRFKINSGAHDLTIRNFDIQNFGGMTAGIRVEGSNIKNINIVGNNVHDALGAEGISVYGESGPGIQNVNIIGNRIHDLKLGKLEALPINGNVEGFKIIGNSGYRIDNIFIDVIAGEGVGGRGDLEHDRARGGVIAYNFSDGASCLENPSYYERSASGIYSDGGAALEIYGNYIRGSDYNLALASEHEEFNSTLIQVHNNIFEKSTSHWLKLGYKGGADHSELTQNLIVNDAPSNYDPEGPNDMSTIKLESNLGASSRDTINKLPTLILELAGLTNTSPRSPAIDTNNKPHHVHPKSPWE